MNRGSTELYLALRELMHSKQSLQLLLPDSMPVNTTVSAVSHAYADLYAPSQLVSDAAINSQLGLLRIAFEHGDSTVSLTTSGNRLNSETIRIDIEAEGKRKYDTLQELFEISQALPTLTPPKRLHPARISPLIPAIKSILPPSVEYRISIHSEPQPSQNAFIQLPHNPASSPQGFHLPYSLNTDSQHNKMLIPLILQQHLCGQIEVIEPPTNNLLAQMISRLSICAVAAAHSLLTAPAAQSPDPAKIPPNRIACSKEGAVFFIPTSYAQNLQADFKLQGPDGCYLHSQTQEKAHSI
jgi:hypothetical protein